MTLIIFPLADLTDIAVFDWLYICDVQHTYRHTWTSQNNWYKMLCIVQLKSSKQFKNTNTSKNLQCLKYPWNVHVTVLYKFDIPPQN